MTKHHNIGKNSLFPTLLLVNSVLQTISSNCPTNSFILRRSQFLSMCPRLWNSLPMNIRENTSLEQFKKTAKIFCLTVLITHNDDFIMIIQVYVIFLIVI